MTEKTLKDRVELGGVDREILKLKESLVKEKIDHQRTRALHKAAIEEIEDHKSAREFLFKLTEGEVTPPSWTLKKQGSKKSEHVPVLLASDFQWGEVIDSGRMGGVNEFSIPIAQQRYKRLIERTIDISFNHLPNNTYKGIIYLRLGDMISGDIHEDLNESNEAHAIEAVRSLVASEAWGIQELIKAFGSVYVISVAGNHGRNTKKMMFKRGAVDNFDSLSAWWLESMFIGEKRATFHTPPNYDAIFNIYGRRYLATHGDRIGARGGQGFIGPAATIMRGMKKTFDTYNLMKMPIEKMFIGHFHTSYELDYGWSNGSLPGYSELAQDNRMKPENPCQWLLFFHRKYGVTSRWQVMLEDVPVIGDDQIVTPLGNV